MIDILLLFICYVVFSCFGVASTDNTLQAREVYNSFDEDGIISQIGAFASQFSQRTEERAATGDVHLTDWPLKGGGGDIRAKSIDNVLPVVLIQEH